MKFKDHLTVDWVSNFIDAKTLGDTSVLAYGINEIHKVCEGDITFVDNEKYYNVCLKSLASVIIINKETECPPNKVLLIVDDPFDAYNKIVRWFSPFKKGTKLISDSAVIKEGTYIGPGTFIGNNVCIGLNCVIHPNVTIYDNCIVGDNVVIHSGSVIGADAFYYKRRPGREIMFDKMVSCGMVIIQNDVEIGACSTIDRGVSGDTIIGAGSKLDNHVHIGHDTVIGRNCLFAAQVGVAGTVVIEDEVILWGQVGVNKDLTIGSKAVVLAQSGVPSSIKGSNTYFGSPVSLAREKMRDNIWIKRIPEIWARIQSNHKIKPQ